MPTATKLWDSTPSSVLTPTLIKGATEHAITREEQDAFAIESYTRAQAAHKSGVYKREICPVTVTIRGKSTVVDMDEEVGNVRQGD